MGLKEDLILILKSRGNRVKVNNKKTLELIDYNFFPYNFNYKIDKIEEKYIKDKLKKYHEQIRRVIKILKKDEHSRQAVIQFDTSTSKPNCVIDMQFLIRTDLIVIVTSRSLDVEKKLYTDIEITKRICDVITKELNTKLDYIRFNVGSLHIYL